MISATLLYSVAYSQRANGFRRIHNKNKLYLYNFLGTYPHKTPTPTNLIADV